jgi:two-component system, cell cycle sensor histidine kinase and response regulator CckA
VINGYAEMLLGAPVQGQSATEPLKEIQKAGERAAGLTQQLLAFSRRQVIKPAVININSVVRDTETLLRRLIGEDVTAGAIIPKMPVEKSPALCRWC